MTTVWKEFEWNVVVNWTFFVTWTDEPGMSATVIASMSMSSQTISPLKNGMLGWMTPWEALSQICRALLSELMNSKEIEMFSHQSPMEEDDLANVTASLVVLNTSRDTMGKVSSAIRFRGQRTSNVFTRVSSAESPKQGWISFKPLLARDFIWSFNRKSVASSSDFVFTCFCFDFSNLTNFSSTDDCTRTLRIWFKSSDWKQPATKSAAESRSADSVTIIVDLVFGSFTWKI